MHKLAIIDGNAIMHRAFHALPLLTDKDGNEANAIYGFLSMLIKIVQDLHPTHLAVCFDRPEPTFRKSMYVGYQAKRPKMDKGLADQLNRTKEIVKKLNISLYELAGYEADDVIGTLAAQANNQQSTTSNQHFDEIIIVTGDRDILQLVDEKVHVYMPIQGLTNAKLYTSKDVEEKYGIKPIQIIDYKALAGDSSDNYPGVRGIGPKTASELLQKYGSLENMYDAIRTRTNGVDLLSEKTIQALSEYAEDAALAKKLATIDRLAPITFHLESSTTPDLNAKHASEIIESLGFHSLVKRLGKNHENRKPKDQKVKKEKRENKDNGQLSFV